MFKVSKSITRPGLGFLQGKLKELFRIQWQFAIVWKTYENTGCWPHHKSFWFSRNPTSDLGWGPRICVSDELPNAAVANVSGSCFENHWTIDLRPHQVQASPGKCYVSITVLPTDLWKLTLGLGMGILIVVSATDNTDVVYHRTFWTMTTPEPLLTIKIVWPHLLKIKLVTRQTAYGQTQ